MKQILSLYNKGKLSEHDTVQALNKHVLATNLSAYLTQELLDMVSMWHKGKLPTHQLELID